MKHLLIFDESRDILELFPYIFKKDNYLIDCCDNVQRFYQLLQQKTPDLIIIDVVESGIDQMMLCYDLKKRNALKEVPIIITSTYARHIKNYKDFSATAAIEKPFSINIIRTLVQSLLPVTQVVY